MGKQKKKQKKRGNPLWTLVFLAALAVFCFSGYKLIGIYLDYKTGTDEYRDLQQYTTEITKTPETPAPTKTEEPQGGYTDEYLQNDLSLTVIVPSFMISELKRAFQMGFLIFLPFLVIDLVVGSTLMSMGMMMLPPAMISMPFKILVFVLADGWNLLIGSVVASYNL